MSSDILDTPDSAYELVTTTPGPGREAAADRRTAAPRAERRPVRLDAERRHGLEPGAVSAARSSRSSARTAGCAPRTARRSRSASTPATGRSALLVKAAAEEFAKLRCIPFAGAVTDPCDGRTQGTVGMFDSLPYRNDSSQVMRRLMRSHPTRAGVMGVATCDKGLPAMMMALAAQHDHPTILVPGGVMLAGETGDEDTGKVQTIGAATHMARSRSNRPPKPAATPVRRPAAAASSSAPRPLRK